MSAEHVVLIVAGLFAYCIYAVIRGGDCDAD